MGKTRRLVMGLAVLVFLAGLVGYLCGCSSPPPPPPPNGTSQTAQTSQNGKKGTAGCDCSIFPPRSGCDAQCGITTGVVESVQGDSVTIRVPTTTTDAAGRQVPATLERKFSIGAEEAKQLQSIAPGSRVALTFQKETGQSVVKTIRAIPKEQLK
jgi:hypothetical protein